MAVNSFLDTVVGQTTNCLAEFILDKHTDTAMLHVTFELIDGDGIIYASGVGNNTELVPRVNAKCVQSQINLTVPSAIPVNQLGTSYQVRMSLHLTDNSKVDLFSNIRVLPAIAVQEGTGDVIEIMGRVARSTIVIPEQATDIVAILFYENMELAIPSLPVSSGVPTADGWQYHVDIDSSTLDVENGGAAFFPSLPPYTLIWQYITPSIPRGTETNSVWFVTPSILQAASDLLKFVNKARSGLGDRPTFSVTDALRNLRSGGDYWNSYSHPTDFTFLNATGGVRQFWMIYSQVSALREQYLFEAESTFDFQGDAIQLNIDRTQYYDAMANQLENSANDPAAKFKTVLSKRGNTSGDGDVNPLMSRPGALGHVAVTYSPVSRLRLRNYTGGYFNFQRGLWW